MKQLYTFLIGCLLLTGSFTAKAQSFSVLHDTVYITSGGIQESIDSCFNYTASTIDIDWKVLSTDFPTDWQYNAGFCEPTACYYMSTLYPSGTTPATWFSPGYGTASAQNLFNYYNDLTAASPGCHYVQVRLNNQAIPTDTAIITYIVCKPVAAQVAAITSASEDEIVYYPNPAFNSLNIIYSELLRVKNIAIYNIIGKQMNLYSPTDSKSAMLNIENIPSGIYYLRLLNESGNVIATRRFMKQ